MTVRRTTTIEERAHGDTADTLRALRFACPVCLTPLEAAAGGLCCPTDGRFYAWEGGIWRLLPPERAAAFDPFLRDYQTVRAAEGWGRPDPEYYRSLPRVRADDLRWNAWRIREKSFQALIARVLRPLEISRGRPLAILDLGAGNCWLAYRMAQRGHQVAAVDVSIDQADGLGAHAWYSMGEMSVAASASGLGDATADQKGGRFTPVQAEFDRLPFDGDQVDLVIFNASLHYSTSYQATISEALRVLRPDGAIVLLDSPFYRDPRSGAEMVHEREAEFSRLYGFASDAIQTEGFLTEERIEALATTLNLRWRAIHPIPRWRSTLRSWKAKARGEREPATFPLIVGHWVPLHRADSWKPARWAWRQLLGWRFRLFQRRRYDRLVLETVLGKPILVLPRVFNPKLLRTGEFLVSALDARLIPPGSSVLDLGAGSGVGAVIAARWAERVVAVDINPAAVRCARINAILNRVDDRVTVRFGDLFAPVADERFDVVLFNPPFFRGEPRDALDRAWRSTDLIERFAAELDDHLTRGGHALVVLSSDGEALDFIRAFRANRLVIEVVAKRDLINEVLTVYRMRRAR